MLEWPEILLILIVLLLLFGAKKLPDTARSLGRSLRIFKSELRAEREESHPGPTQTAELPPASGAVPPPTPADANGSGSTPRREPFAGS